MLNNLNEFRSSTFIFTVLLLGKEYLHGKKEFKPELFSVLVVILFVENLPSKQQTVCVQSQLEPLEETVP